MLIALLIGLGIGFVMAIPPGPVGVTAMKLSLNKGRKQGFLFSGGNGVMDFVYCLLAVFSADAIRSGLETFSGEHPIIMFLIQMLIVVGIFIFGFINLRIKADKHESEIKKTTLFSDFFNKLANKGPFLLGIAIALTNLPNPTYFPTLVGMSGFILDLNFFDAALVSKFAFALGFGLGNVAWLSVLVKVLSHYKSKLSDITLAKIHRFAGFTLIGFGTILGYHVYSITKWPTIFRLIFAF